MIDLAAESSRLQENHIRPNNRRVWDFQQIKLRLLIAVAVAFVIFLAYVAACASHDFSLSAEQQPQESVVPSPFFEILQENTPATQFPKILWVYSDSARGYMEVPEPQLTNYRHFLGSKEFLIQRLTPNNYRRYIPQAKLDKIDAISAQLRLKKEHYQLKLLSIESMIDKLIWRTIMMHVLYTQGGILIDEGLLLTENFGWIERNQQEAKSKKLELEVIAIEDPTFNAPNGESRVVPSALMAAKRQAFFIKEMCSQLLKLMAHPQIEWPKLQDDLYEQKIDSELRTKFDPYLVLTNHLLQSRSIGPSVLQIPSTKFGLIYFKIALVRFSDKFGGITESSKYHNYLSRLPANQFSLIFSPLPVAQYFLSNFDNQWLFKYQKSKAQAMRGSIMSSIFPNAKLYDNIQKSSTNYKAPIWSSLPKIIWVYSESWEERQVPSLAKFFNKFLYVQNQKKGYEIRKVDKNNVKQYLSQEKLQKIDQILHNKTGLIFRSTASQLYRLALLEEHGGVFLESGVFTERDLNWVWQIARAPSQLIYNRYGTLPKVLAFFHPLRGGSDQWSVFPGTNTKSFDHAGIMNQVLAAEKGSQFMKDWFEEALNLLGKMKDEVVNTFNFCGVTGDNFMTVQGLQLLPLDVANCILRQRLIKIIQQKEKGVQSAFQWVNSAHYYGLWSMNGYIGPIKITRGRHFDEPYRPYPSFLFQYPVNEVQQRASRNVIPMFQLNATQLVTTDHFFSHPGPQRIHIHPGSFFMRVMNSSNLVFDDTAGERAFKDKFN